MSQSEKTRGVAVLRGLFVVLCSAIVLCIVETPAQAQSLLTRHMRQEVISGQAAYQGRLPENQTLRLNIVLPVRDPSGLEQFVQRLRSFQSLLPALPHGAGIYRAVWAQPGRI